MEIFLLTLHKSVDGFLVTFLHKKIYRNINFGEEISKLFDKQRNKI